MQLLGVDAEVQNLDDVLNNLDITCDALKAIRDFMTDEEQWPDGKNLTTALYRQGLLLSAVVRHMEQLINRGHQYHFAQRRQGSSAA